MSASDDAVRPAFSVSRVLKVRPTKYEYQLHGNRWPTPPQVPFVLLRGYWLNKAGFAIGQMVNVHVGDRWVMITSKD